jgi:hypothetical protein
MSLPTSKFLSFSHLYLAPQHLQGVGKPGRLAVKIYTGDNCPHACEAREAMKKEGYGENVIRDA